MDYDGVPSVWDAIRARVSASEANEVKQVLGESLVDQVLDLREEVGIALRRIYRQLLGDASFFNEYSR